MPVIPALWRPRQTITTSGVGDQPGQYGETLSLLNTKISWVWGWASVIPPTWEAEAEESLEPGQQRFLQ